MTDKSDLQLRGRPKTAKSTIIQKLAQEFPLTTKQLSQALQREYGLNITYQAVHKALQELEKEHVATKTNGEWMLNQGWLDSQENFILQTKQKYAGNKNRYNINLNYNGPQVFEFDNFTSVCVETAKLLMSRKLNPAAEPFHCILEYGWWSLKFKFEHLELLYDMVVNCPRSVGVIQKKTKFGEWITKQYKRIGGIQAPIGTNMHVKEDIFIQGNYIIQIQLSEEGKKIIEKLWSKWENLEDCFKEFGLKKEPKMKITVTVSQNPVMARFMKEQIQKCLEEGKNHGL